MSSRALAVAGGVLALLLAGVFVLQNQIAQVLVVQALQRQTGATVTLDSVASDGSHVTLQGLRLTGIAGGVEVTLDRLVLDGTLFDALAVASGKASQISAGITGAHVEIGGTGNPLDRVSPFAASLAHAAATQRLTLRIEDGSAALDRSPDDALLETPQDAASSALPLKRPFALAGLTGIVHVGPESTDYDLRFLVASGASTYPVGVTGSGSEGEPVVHHFSAELLPVSAVRAFMSPLSPLEPRGELRQVDVRYDAVQGLSGSMDLHDAALTLGKHHIAGLRGIVRLGGNRLGTPVLRGTVDGVPLEALGEVDDLQTPSWLSDGSKDLSRLSRLLADVLAQPNLGALMIEQEAPGVALARYTAQDAVGPRAIAVLAVDPREPTVHLDTAIAEDHVISKGERTSMLAARTKAVGGVNGDYFDIGRSYEPQGMLVSNGKLLRSPTDRMALAIHRDGRVTFDEYHCSGTLSGPGSRLPISEYNIMPPGYASIVTPDYGKVLHAYPGLTFYGLTPLDAGKHLYRIGSAQPLDAEMPATLGVVVGPLDGRKVPPPGSAVRVTYACSPSLDGVTAVIGGGPLLLRHGVWYEDPHPPAPDELLVRWPVVALGRLADGTLMFFAVDGRHPERAVGMTRPEFANLMQSFGVDEAMALDSGGSVTLVSRAPGDDVPSVRNVPSDDGGERWISDGLFVYSSAPKPTIAREKSAGGPLPTPRPDATPGPEETP